jgi:DnaK suppressor protein
MADAADHAQALAEVERSDALAARAARMFHEEPRVVNGQRLCLDCDEPLSKKRLKFIPEAVRCVDCQNLLEQRQRRR